MASSSVCIYGQTVVTSSRVDIYLSLLVNQILFPTNKECIPFTSYHHTTAYINHGKLFFISSRPLLTGDIRATVITITEEEEEEAAMAADGAVGVVTMMTGCPTWGADCGLSTGPTHDLSISRRTSTLKISELHLAAKRKLKTSAVPRRFE